jgi:hypothetical protein
MINKKSLISYPNYLKNIFSVISLNNIYNIVGTSSVRGILYTSDYDLNMHLIEHNTKEETINHIDKIFNNLFHIIDKDENIYFMDFKIAGLHWTLNELLKGSKNKIKFKNGLLSDEIIKLDIVVRLSYANFVEISMIYNLEFEEKTIDEHHDLTLSKIKDDIHKEINEYMAEHSYFKSLRRLFSLYKLTESKNIKILFDFFNADIGIINKVRVNVDIYYQLMDKYHMDLNEMKFALQSQKDYLNNIIQNIYVLHIYEDIDAACNLKNDKSFKLKLKKIYDELNKIVQRETLKFIDNNKLIKKDLNV